MRSTKQAAFAIGGLFCLAIIGAAFIGFGAPGRDLTREGIPEWVQALTDHLIEIKPTLDQLDLMEDVIMSVKATSPTLEKLDELVVRAEAVRELNSALERLQKIEPVLASLEEMQRDFARRNRTPTGALPRKLPAWSEIFGRIQSRLDALEKRVYSPAVVRDPVAAQRPVEQRLDELEQRQKELLKELDSIQRDLRRLRRQQRDETM